jgi:hypothetical protein
MAGKGSFRIFTTERIEWRVLERVRMRDRSMSMEK